MSFSILILTLNEAVNIRACLESVKFSDDVVVLDSRSTDSTIKIAHDFNTTVLTREFDNYASQRNFGLSHDFKYEWIFILDADERMPSNAVEEILKITKQKKNPVMLYNMRRKDMFMGRWLKHSSGYPTWIVRLFRKGRVRYEREINEKPYTDGEVGLLEEHLIHYPFNKGIEYWFERHNRYSSMEAKKMIDERNKKIMWRNFLNSDPVIRREVLKLCAYRMPLRPLFAFCYLYFVRLGFLDGKAGLHYSLMRLFYEYMISLKISELKRLERNLPV